MKIVILLAASGTPGDPVERIKSGCQKEFGTEGQIVVNNCILTLEARWLAEHQKAKLDRASSGY